MSRPRRAIEPARGGPSRAVLVTGALVSGAALVAGLALVPPLLRPDAPAPGGSSPVARGACPAPAALTVDPVHEAAVRSASEAWGESLAPGCRPVGLTLAASHDVATSGLGEARGWVPEDPQWADAVTDPALRESEPSVVAWTPLVLATPAQAGTALGGPLAGPALVEMLTLQKTWADHGHADWGRLKLALPQVDRTVAGAVGFGTLVGQVQASSPAPQDPAAATQAGLALITLQDRVVAQYPDAAEVVSHLDADPADATAVNPAGPRAGLTTEAAALAAPDVVAARLGDGSTGLRLGVLNPTNDPTLAAFTTWLGTDPGQQALASAGWHAGPHAPDADRLAQLQLSGEAPEPTPLSRDQVEQSRGAFAKLARRQANLTVLDTSGSMESRLPGTDLRRIDVVSKAATFDWSRWPSRSRSGMITFNTDAAFHPQITVAAPLTRIDDPAWQQAGAAQAQGLQQVRVQHGTPLYEAIWRSYEYMLSEYEDGYDHRIVVLTDGINEAAPSAMSEAELMTKLADRPTDKPITLVLVALGPEADHAALERIAAATGSRAVWVRSVAELPTVMEGLFTDR